MATQKNALAVCDECGFVYPHRVMRLNSYGMLVCPQDFEGQYDLKNHPQNRVANVKDDPAILNSRPDSGGRGVLWDEGTMFISIDMKLQLGEFSNPDYGVQTRTENRPDGEGLSVYKEGQFPNLTTWTSNDLYAVIDGEKVYQYKTDIDWTTNTKLYEFNKHTTQWDDSNKSWDLI
jgi:hypothetical protein